MSQKRVKKRVHPTYICHTVVGKATAEREGLLVLTTTEYSSRFFVCPRAALHRYRQLKVRGFKHSGKIYLVVSKDSKDGF